MLPTKMKWVCLSFLTMIAVYANAQTNPELTRALLVKFESDLSYTQTAHGKSCSDTKLSMATDFISLKYSNESKAYEGYAPIRCTQFVVGNCDGGARNAARTTDGELFFKVTPTSDSSLVVYYEVSQQPEQEWSDVTDAKNSQLTSGPLWSSYYSNAQSDMRIRDGYEMYNFSVRNDRAAKIFTQTRTKSFDDRMSKVSDTSTLTLTYIGVDTRNQTQVMTPTTGK
jgi:hypothetical protein